MSNHEKARFGWIKFMYIYTILGAGGSGLGMLFAPELMKSLFKFPPQDPVVFGIVGSVYVAFGVLSILGLRSPLKFTPILLLQLCYKSIWMICVILPLLFAGKVEMYAVMLTVFFITYIIGDLIAIPFTYVFKKE
ncbi:MAG: hypothetical protein JW984_04150 [Deltaproteobacteria bacterium]|uniref:Uncharacterized protein n=1 Tax=Candidatus Zymogenus saltonus TaxID=2844893 RepID=A0A9D8PJZ0_9DELT|nr:hypothetical protein [Candidatus Zymogenus saltonus]